MAQIKIYGLRENLEANAQRISDVVHRAAVAALGLPEDKRFHRLLPLEPWQCIAPADRSERYLIIEVVLFAGRSTPTRRAFVRQLMDGLTQSLDLKPVDVEVVLIESPRENWGIRGQHGDELVLAYDPTV